jgi:hypothetical protein
MAAGSLTAISSVAPSSMAMAATTSRSAELARTLKLEAPLPCA